MKTSENKTIGELVQNIKLSKTFDHRFRITLSAKLESGKELKERGEGPHSLRKQGKLGWTTRHGFLARRQYLNLSAYRIRGEAEYSARATLRLPGIESGIDATLSYVTDVLLPSLGKGVIAKEDASIRFPRETIAYSMDGKNMELAHLLKVSALNNLKGLEVDVEQYLIRLFLWLAPVPSSVVMREEDSHVKEFILDLARKSAENYRSWFHKKWWEEAHRFDSKLLVGKVRYEYDEQGESASPAKVVAQDTIYRAA